MRPILIDDLLLAARAAGLHPPEMRAGRLAQWLGEAHGADLYRKRLGRMHPRWGNGSLMARAMAEPLARPLRPDGEEIEVLAQVIAAVLHWRRRNGSGRGALQRPKLALFEGHPV